VPQGSILGLMLYYMKDFQYAVECIPRLYANDNCLVIQYSLNSEIATIEQWMYANPLTINPQKSAMSLG